MKTFFISSPDTKVRPVHALHTFFTCWNQKANFIKLSGNNPGFREDLFLIGQAQLRTAYGCHISCTISMKYGNFVLHLQYKVTIHCSSSFQRFFKFQPIRNKNCLNRDEMRKSYRGPSIDAYCKISLYLAKRFERTRFLEINQPETRIVYGYHVFNGWGQNKQSL